MMQYYPDPTVRGESHLLRQMGYTPISSGTQFDLMREFYPPNSHTIDAICMFGTCSGNQMGQMTSLLKKMRDV